MALRLRVRRYMPWKTYNRNLPGIVSSLSCECMARPIQALLVDVVGYQIWLTYIDWLCIMFWVFCYCVFLSVFVCFFHFNYLLRFWICSVCSMAQRHRNWTLQKWSRRNKKYNDDFIRLNSSVKYLTFLGNFTLLHLRCGCVDHNEDRVNCTDIIIYRFISLRK